MADFFFTQREPLSQFMSCSPSSPVKILHDLKQRWFYACFHWRIFFTFLQWWSFFCHEYLIGFTFRPTTIWFHFIAIFPWIPMLQKTDYLSISGHRHWFYAHKFLMMLLYASDPPQMQLRFICLWVNPENLRSAWTYAVLALFTQGHPPSLKCMGTCI